MAADHTIAVVATGSAQRPVRPRSSLWPLRPEFSALTRMPHRSCAPSSCFWDTRPLPGGLFFGPLLGNGPFLWSVSRKWTIPLGCFREMDHSFGPFEETDHLNGPFFRKWTNAMVHFHGPPYPFPSVSAGQSHARTHDASPAPRRWKMQRHRARILLPALRRLRPSSMPPRRQARPRCEG